MKFLRSYWAPIVGYAALSFLVYQTHIRPLARIQKCEAEFGLTNSTDDSCPQCVKHQFRIGEDGGTGLGFNGQVSRKQPKGENHFLFHVRKDNKIFFTYQIPVEVR